MFLQRSHTSHHTQPPKPRLLVCLRFERPSFLPTSFRLPSFRLPSFLPSFLPSPRGPWTVRSSVLCLLRRQIGNQRKESSRVESVGRMSRRGQEGRRKGGVCVGFCDRGRVGRAPRKRQREGETGSCSMTRKRRDETCCKTLCWTPHTHTHRKRETERDDLSLDLIVWNPPTRLCGFFDLPVPLRLLGGGLVWSRERERMERRGREGKESIRMLDRKTSRERQRQRRRGGRGGGHNHTQPFPFS